MNFKLQGRNFFFKRAKCALVPLSFCFFIYPLHAQSQWVEPDLLTPISQFTQVVTDSTLSDSQSTDISVAGIANVQSGLLHETYLQTYLQNDSSGVSIFGYSIDEDVAEGDSVVVKGKKQLYFGQPELLVTEYKVYPRDEIAHRPVEIFEAFRSPANYQGMLVEGSGVIKSKGNRFNGKYLMIAPTDTAANTVMIYASNFHALYQDFDFNTPGVGDAVTVTGVVGQYDPAYPESVTYKVFLRTPDDISYAGWPRYYYNILGLILLTIIVVAATWTISLKKQVKSKTERLEGALTEKNFLLQEIHHRVKNNLASISGILELQAGTSDSDEVQNVLRESQTRIKSMVIVHEKLYQSISDEHLNMQVYLEELAQSIRQTVAPNSSNIDIRVSADGTGLEKEKVIPLGLLVNELLVNAFKHAFKNKEGGAISIELSQNKQIITLKVEDNGVGLPENLDTAKSDSLGMLLIKTFAQQLGAEKTVKNTPGACFIFHFPRKATQ